MIKDDKLILSFAGHDPTGGAGIQVDAQIASCLLYTSPSPRD